MSYPASIRESLEKVEATRTARLGQVFPRLTTQERQDILRSFHPDYIADAFTELRLGPNKGDRAPRELVLALEAPALIEPSLLDGALPEESCDVLVIGGGGAGASAALLAPREWC